MLVATELVGVSVVFVPGCGVSTEDVSKATSPSSIENSPLKTSVPSSENSCESLVKKDLLPVSNSSCVKLILLPEPKL